MQSVIKPGILMTDMCEELENLNRRRQPSSPHFPTRLLARPPTHPPTVLAAGRASGEPFTHAYLIGNTLTCRLVQENGLKAGIAFPTGTVR